MTIHPADPTPHGSLERALLDADLPPLLAALAAATGDDDLLAPELRPRVTDKDLVDPFQGGMSEVEQALARQRALHALQSHPVAVDSAAMSPERLRRSAAFIVGEAHVDEYMPMLAYEFGMTGKPDETAAWPETPAPDDFHVVVVGAGMSGIAAAAELQRAGLRFTLIERAPDVGGVWFENNYPGCRLDTNNFAYSYSWAQKSDWLERFSSRAAVVDYFGTVANAIDVRKNALFNARLVRAEWDESDQLWRLEVETPSGTRNILANAVISAVGQLNLPNTPEIPGQESFQGVAVHTASWPDGLELQGKRVAVVGSGASAFQAVPEIARVASSLSVYQRSAPWMLPTPGYREAVPDGLALLFTMVPDYHRWFRFYQYWLTQNRHRFAAVDPAWERSDSVSAPNARLRQVLVQHIERQYADRPELLPFVVPAYPPYGKRMLRDDGSWATALKSDNTRLVTEPILEITEHGLRTASADDEVDVIVYATGFRASQFLSGIEVVGRDGQRLSDVWGDSPRAYLGVTVPGFPNFFTLYGPNTNLVVNGSLISMTEAGVAHVMACLRHLSAAGGTSIECRRETLDEFCAEVDHVNESMAWGIESVSSWYKNAAGRVTQNWPFTVDDYFRRTTTWRAGVYDITVPAESTASRTSISTH